MLDTEIIFRIDAKTKQEEKQTQTENEEINVEELLEKIRKKTVMLNWSSKYNSSINIRGLTPLF